MIFINYEPLVPICFELFQRLYHKVSGSKFRVMILYNPLTRQDLFGCPARSCPYKKSVETGGHEKCKSKNSYIIGFINPKPTQELGIMDLHWRELSIEQKRVEHMLTDLTRCIRGIEFDLKLIADLEKQRQSKAKGSTKSSDKKSPKVGDFSD